MQHMQQIYYHIGFNAYDSSILIGKTEEEAEIFINKNTVLFIGNGRWDNGDKYPIYEIRIMEEYMEKTYCKQRLNVYIDDTTGLIKGIDSIG